MRCPHCGNLVVQTALDGRKKIRTPIVIFDSDGKNGIVKCRECGGEVPLPLTLDLSVASPLGQRILVRAAKSA